MPPKKFKASGLREFIRALEETKEAYLANAETRAKEQQEKDDIYCARIIHSGR